MTVEIKGKLIHYIDITLFIRYSEGIISVYFYLFYIQETKKL